MNLQKKLEAEAKKQLEIEAKTKAIVDSIFSRERAKCQKKLDNLESTREQCICYYRKKLETATDNADRVILQTKLDNWNDIEGRRKRLLEMLESYK